MKAFGLTLRIAGGTLALMALQALWSHPRNRAELCLSVIPGLLVSRDGNYQELSSSSTLESIN